MVKRLAEIGAGARAAVLVTELEELCAMFPRVTGGVAADLRRIIARDKGPLPLLAVGARAGVVEQPHQDGRRKRSRASILKQIATRKRNEAQKRKAAGKPE